MFSREDLIQRIRNAAANADRLHPDDAATVRVMNDMIDATPQEREDMLTILDRLWALCRQYGVEGMVPQAAMEAGIIPRWEYDLCFRRQVAPPENNAIAMWNMCGRPHVLSAGMLGVEIVRILGAERISRDADEVIDERAPCPVREFVTPLGGKVAIDLENARVMVTTDMAECGVTIYPDRMAITYAGDYSAEAVVPFLALDSLHEGGAVPHGTDRLTAPQLVALAEMRAEASSNPSDGGLG